MGGKRIFLTAACTVALVLSLLSNVAASAVDEQWPMPNTPWPGFYSTQIDDVGTWGVFSLLQADYGKEKLICTSTSDGDCAKADEFSFTAYLPICGTTAQLDCIESLSVTDENGIVEKASFEKYTMPSHPNLFSGNPKLLLPDAASPSIWRFENHRHSLGNLFGLGVSLEGQTSFERPRAASSIRIHLAAVSLYDGDNSGPYDNGIYTYGNCYQIVENATGLRKPFCGKGAEDTGLRYCSFKLQDSGDCLLRQPFPKDVRYSVRVRLSSPPSGWLHGRMDAPDISITQYRSGSSMLDGMVLDVAAGALSVPTFYAGALWKDLPKSIQDFFRECISSGRCGTSARIPNPQNTPRSVEEASVGEVPSPSDPKAMELMALWREFAKDSSVAVPSAWTLRTISNSGQRGTNACLAPDTTGMKGVVTTNATAYSDGPPAFDGSQLSYSVMAPHYYPDGKTEFLGRYNLLLRSDVARCLYGFSNAPLQASISVVTSDGNTRVATTTANEKDGWLRLSAHGFTFSQPTIVVKLTQAPAVTQQTPGAPATVKPSAKKSVNCVKGKQTKKFAAAKCPSGWKRR